jgi:hypothetical protein
MDPALKRIKALVATDRIRLTEKSATEMYENELSIADIRHVIMNADHITDSYPSSNPYHHNEMLYVIIGQTVNEMWIYTKGCIRHGQFYVLVSARLT